MDIACLTPILNVSDMAASFAWFEKLGWKKLWDWGTPPTFGAVGSGKVEIFLCLGAQGSRGGPVPRHADDDDTGGVWMSWFLNSPADVDAAHALAVSHGMTVTQPPTNEPWGVREFHLRHPDGHTFRVGAGTGSA
ncbi:Glyoxalase-like domain protein [Gemmata sp. SH-PL17]|uniref:bleomycin resistance family protein n=1 Tax=Gemmata sp. SH-PL17 TaxID=1630693 RepID=UPI00078C0CB9|nr:bleomycin resistance family protein [Gemmata sp. SH-PL17]AMV26658.1 Glyoxalase-like domain protein [Gemmata sp. SH-PL17]